MGTINIEDRLDRLQDGSVEACRVWRDEGVSPAHVEGRTVALFACPACNRQFEVKEGLAAKSVKCPACGKPIGIPAVPSNLATALFEPGRTSPAPGSRLTNDDLLTAASACPAPEVLHRLARGVLCETQAQRLGDHVLVCTLCATFLDGCCAADPLVADLKDIRYQQQVDDAAEEALAQRLAAAPPDNDGTPGAHEPATFGAVGSSGSLLPNGAGNSPRAANPVNEKTEVYAAGKDRSAELTDFLAPPEAPDEIGRLGGYRIRKILGAGGMGVVFQGEDARLGRKVAIKAMLPHLAGSRSSRERFLREARAAATLEHDHVVAIHHVAEARGAPFIVMPFLQGEPLDKRLEREPRLLLTEVLRIGRQTALGLAAAHKKGLIHRDIKPANIWLEAETERVKILDFGLARAAGDNSQLTQQGAIVGTPAYIAPEQASGATVDARCDLFSLGCVLYRLATGQPAFKGKDVLSALRSVAIDIPTAPHEVDPRVPEVLSDLVLELLAKDPAERPSSAAAVAERLADIAEAVKDEVSTRPGQETDAVKRAGKTGIVAWTPPTSRRRSVSTGSQGSWSRCWASAAVDTAVGLMTTSTFLDLP